MDVSAWMCQLAQEWRLSSRLDSRHSCAVALLQAGNDPTVIRDYLGHASVATTNRYISSNLQMKREALERFWRRAGLAPTRAAPWKPKPDLLAFLTSL